MKKSINTIPILTSILLICVFSSNLMAQSNARIENIDFYASGSNLNITYDIIKSKSGESFEIWVKVITDSGKEIIPTSVTGDVGKGVSGGPDKRIVWNVSSDNVVIDEEISVEVYAQPEIIPASKTETQEKTAYPEKTKSKNEISVGKAMLLSALLPGLGNRYVKGKGAQWLIGIAGYSFIGASVAMNNSAYNAYEDYKSATTASDRDDYFSEAENKNIGSKVFAGAAIAIWILDLTFTGLQAGKARKNSKKQSFSLKYTYDPVIGKPMIGFNYRF